MIIYRHKNYVIGGEITDRKRYTIRFPTLLANELERISIERGLSVNSLITEMCWNFVNDFEKRKKELKQLGDQR